MLTGQHTQLLYNQHPADKLEYIEQLAQSGAKVLMVGDGLNDAGALKKSSVGIAITENVNSFSPASDAIMKASMLPFLHQFLQIAKQARQIILLSFIISIGYNIVGISLAVQAKLSPMAAAILMPVSSISILLITWASTTVVCQKIKKHEIATRK